jgi:ABC-type transport system involved in multi-copper enzyme maturation permease subunit
MIKLICNECKRAKFGQYVLIIAIGNLAALFLAISSSSMLNHTSYGIQAFAPGMPAFSLSTVDLGMMLMRSILIVWQAVLISQMIISEYQTKTITMLFTYPYSRKGIICAKLILIGGIMTVAHIVTLFIQHMVIYLFSLTNPIILFSFQNPLSIIIITISSILLAFIPLAIGVKFKSTIATIITSLVIAAIVSNSQGSTAGILSNPIIAGVLGLCGLIVSIVTFRKMLKEDL